MRTENLIAALVADRQAMDRPIAQTMLIAVIVGGAIATLAFVWQLGPRSDFALAIETTRFQLKFVVALALLIPALALVIRQARPDQAELGKLGLAIFISPLLLAAACVFEVHSLPVSEVMPRLIGSNSIKCLFVIPLLSVAPLGAILFALSKGAPSRPGGAGALAGLAAAAFAATLYATNCRDDSPLFMGVWYVSAIIGVVAVGYSVGRKILRW